MKSNRFKEGMDKDVYDAINLDYNEEISEEVKQQLLNDCLMIISSNSRQIELYNFIIDEIYILINQLKSKCSNIDDYIQ